MTGQRFPGNARAELADGFAGQLIAPEHPGYDGARALHNGLIDKRPGLIARCQGLADIVHAVRVARAHDIEIAVRGGGHNVAGRASTDGGLMIDLCAMQGVHVDPAARRARAQSGATWGAFNRETQAFGLATTGGLISTTGVAGLTLGGGHGWLMGKHGLSVDNLLAVQLVTADAEVQVASERENPELFWGLRGGGGNFGVAAWLDFQLHPVTDIVGGVLAHPFSSARDVMRSYRDFTATLPDELIVHLGLLHGPDGGKIVAALVCYAGPAKDADRALAPLVAMGEPLVNDLGPLSYCAINTMLDAGFPKGAHNYWKSSFMSELDDSAIDAAISAFEACPSPMSSVLLEHFHGACSRVPVTDTAFPHREPGYNILVLGQWADAAGDEQGIAWVRDTYAAMEPFFAPGRYVNYLPHDADATHVAAAYGPTYERLQKLKATYDPHNVFHLNQNIQPTT